MAHPSPLRHGPLANLPFSIKPQPLDPLAVGVFRAYRQVHCPSQISHLCEQGKRLLRRVLFTNLLHGIRTSGQKQLTPPADYTEWSIIPHYAEFCILLVIRFKYSTIASVKQVRYTTPQRQVWFPAEPDAVATHLAESEWLDWDRSANAEACLELASRSKLGGELKYTETLNDSGTFYIYQDDPCIIIKQPEPGSFFLTWMENGDELVPYAGGDVRDFILSHCGGNPFQVPVACMTDLETTIAITRKFFATRSREANITWTSWFELDIPDDWYQ